MASPKFSDRSEVLMLFDVDGTLTPHRNAVRPEVAAFLLDRLMPVATVGLVSGSDLPKLVEQMGGAETTHRFDFVFSENGLVAHRGEELIGRESISRFLGEEKVQKVINFAMRYMSGLTLPAKRGNFVEFRDGLVNFCPVGRSCTQQLREEFSALDKREGVRKRFQAALYEEFPQSEAGLQFAIGGQISIDMFPVGWDKRYCLRYVEDAGFKEIHFFGDRTAEGGNDHEIFEDERTVGHTVTSPEDTVRQVKELLGL